METSSAHLPLISVVLPVYNGEKTVKRCVDSILAQDFEDFELLIVDDGSKDATFEFLNKLYGEETRVRIIRKENGGVSSARNAALDAARGKWVTFIDCDDFAEKNLLSSFAETEELREDTLYINGRKEGFTEKTLKPQPGLFESGRADKRRLQLISNNGTVWGKLFLRRHIEDYALRFNLKVFYGEDKLFAMRYSAHIERVVYNPASYPYRYVNDFNPFKFIKDFDKELTNYTEIAFGMQKEFGSRFSNEWMVMHLVLLFCSLYLLYPEGRQRREKIRYIKKYIPTVQEAFEALSKRNLKTRLLFGCFTGRNYRLMDAVFALFIPLAAKLLRSASTPLWVKRLLKSVL